MMANNFRIQTGSLSHEGKVRPHNEDSFCCLEQNGLWAVADGMGGHENGEWASAVIIEKLQQADIPEEFEAACDKVAEAIHAGNSAIYSEAVARGMQMGTTVVALLVRGNRFAIFWVGDSRAYLLRAGHLYQLSRDHTRVQEMVDAGLLSEEDAQDHPMGHVLARALGVQESLELDVIADELEAGDVLLLCSDGLHGYLEETEILRLLHSGSPQAASDELVEATLQRGAPDNVTVITLSISEPTLVAAAQGATAHG
jgi:serine/threonine protein phosphatase PrpC